MLTRSIRQVPVPERDATRAKRRSDSALERLPDGEERPAECCRAIAPLPPPAMLMYAPRLAIAARDVDAAAVALIDAALRRAALALIRHAALILRIDARLPPPL